MSGRAVSTGRRLDAVHGTAGVQAGAESTGATSATGAMCVMWCGGGGSGGSGGGGGGGGQWTRNFGDGMGGRRTAKEG